MLNEQARHKRTNIICFHLLEVPRVVKFTEAESGIVAARGWGKGELGVSV